MSQLATITGKKQITLPEAIFKKADLHIGQKVIILEENGRLLITPAEKLVEELAGSVKTPKKWQGKDLGRIIKDSKEKYFAKNK
ncbi:hypothetical protein A2697_00395 [Candidatus Curtissbacteria bacterium RIFCSPHIGHO2_01_FULL_41_44]|uniref:SpoVT-AbrB domain-containing protein n=1 Tax=Candidatus Curtissbacteria bacterium RIFCSPLOWO2_01_FULL_42_50 TaxID=1797730 RepID=A0A1F5H4W5_9BACT|nr:MAG: hypothetical protein A2697_00395 [Candidatus Curtissbacteria bacterium RIFCSPHIGHO2_01_FULL_41_44]OGD93583.1 MAG: hypothetical protein A3C33_01545 [Candidatus Curtissbacteria bacterium RIFCSPHIGHO2_02_FULL_42_58]OGD97170.1 MAG: hypothetical protein A3E71_04980 [Candidatus Curtissbacteria bacterium RIFCSPHIGHO2_12_FULL_42_33]OGD99084.1 MAG: hypothetical protein A3B54_05225 [Candidatus Curtissbacteria bacterium RIFCSPLOWO2_01_FULL_42_50]OGE02283.1 MAG: hypothetical protein A3G16_01310 [Ca